MPEVENHGSFHAALWGKAHMQPPRHSKEQNRNGMMREKDPPGENKGKEHSPNGKDTNEFRKRLAIVIWSSRVGTETPGLCHSVGNACHFPTITNTGEVQEARSHDTKS